MLELLFGILFTRFLCHFCLVQKIRQTWPLTFGGEKLNVLVTENNQKKCVSLCSGRLQTQRSTLLFKMESSLAGFKAFDQRWRSYPFCQLLTPCCTIRINRHNIILRRFISCLLSFQHLRWRYKLFPNETIPNVIFSIFFGIIFGIAFQDFWDSVSGSNGKPILT